MTAPDDAPLASLTRRWRAPSMQWGLLLIVTIALVVALRAGHVPAALLFGPLLAAMMFGLRGASIRPAPLVFAGAQALVGCMIATAMTPALLSGLARHGATYLAIAASTLALTTGLGWWMTRRGWLPGTTAIWGLAPGASTAMVLMSDAFGGDRRLVAMIQYLRILMVAAAAVALAHVAGGSSDGFASRSLFGPIDLRQVLITLAVAAVLGLVGRVTRLPAGTFLFAMLGGAGHCQPKPFARIVTAP